MNQEAFQKGFIGECIASNVDALMLKNAAERMSRDMKKEAALGGLLRLGGQALRRYAPNVLPWASGTGGWMNRFSRKNLGNSRLQKSRDDAIAEYGSIVDGIANTKFRSPAGMKPRQF